VKLLTLSSAFDPQIVCESFRINDICELVNNFYSQDFTNLKKTTVGN
jgi:hypothetical protein